MNAQRGLIERILAEQTPQPQAAQQQPAQPKQGVASRIGHAALDVVGLIPGVGELADVTNAIWYINQNRYFDAALSIISMIPGIGDAAGKGVRYLLKGGKAGRKLLSRYAPTIKKHWGTAKNLISKSEKLRPYARQLDQAVQQELSAAQQAPQQQQQQAPQQQAQPTQAPQQTAQTQPQAQPAVA